MPGGTLGAAGQRPDCGWLSSGAVLDVGNEVCCRCRPRAPCPSPAAPLPPQDQAGLLFRERGAAAGAGDCEGGGAVPRHERAAAGHQAGECEAGAYQPRSHWHADNARACRASAAARLWFGPAAAPPLCAHPSQTHSPTPPHATCPSSLLSPLPVHVFGPRPRQPAEGHRLWHLRLLPARAVHRCTGGHPHLHRPRGPAHALHAVCRHLEPGHRGLPAADGAAALLRGGGAGGQRGVHGQEGGRGGGKEEWSGRGGGGGNEERRGGGRVCCSAPSVCCSAHGGVHACVCEGGHVRCRGRRRLRSVDGVALPSAPPAPSSLPPVPLRLVALPHLPCPGHPRHPVQVFDNKEVFRAVLFAELDYESPPWDTLSGAVRWGGQPPWQPPASVWVPGAGSGAWPAAMLGVAGRRRADRPHPVVLPAPGCP